MHPTALPCLMLGMALATACERTTAAPLVTVHVTNGFDATLRVRAGNAATDVAGFSHATLEAPAGPVTFVATLEDGRVVESVPCELSAAPGTVSLYNVLGAAPVVSRIVEYSVVAIRHREPEAPRVLSGVSCVQATAQFAFVDPPRRIESDSFNAEYRRLQLLEGGWETARSLVRRQGSREAEVSILEGVLTLVANDARAVTGILGAMGTAAGTDVAMASAEKVAARVADPWVIERELLELRRRVGSFQRVAGGYRARWEAHPDSALAGLLYAMVLSGSAGFEHVASLATRFPADARVACLHGTALVRRGRFDEAIPELARAWEDVSERGALFRERAEALVAKGRANEAFDLVHDITPQSGGDLATLVAFHRTSLPLGRGWAATEMLAKRIEPTWQPFVRERRDEFSRPDDLDLFDLLAGRSLPRVAVGAPGWTGRLFVALQDLLVSPGRALDALEAADEDTRGRVYSGAAVLLGAEAHRTGRTAIADELFSQAFRVETTLAARAYLGTGERSERLDDLPLELQAALDFVRSRAVTGTERAKLQARAAAKDVFKAVVTSAMRQWPRP